MIYYLKKGHMRFVYDSNNNFVKCILVKGHMRMI